MKALLCAAMVAGAVLIAARTDSPASFVDITASSHLSFRHVAFHTAHKFLLETMGSGVAVFDYDGDGLLDIFAVNGAPLAETQAKGSIPQKTTPETWNRLYRQKKDGSFEDVTERAGLQGVGYGMGVAVGDFDNDGSEDLYVTAYGGNRLYHNNGNGTFSDVTAAAGVGGGGFSTSAAWVDLDNDGRLDLIVLRYLQWDFDYIWCGEHKPGYRAYCHPDTFKPVAPLVFHNEGNGRFTEISQRIGFAKPGKGLGIAIADYDNDGNIDVFIANDSWQQFLYHNKGGGKFEEVGLLAGVAFDADGRSFAGMGTDFADYNNDGAPDIVVDNLALQKYDLFQNAGGGAFTDASESSGLARMTQPHSGWGLRFLDYDNDGWKDLLIAQGHDLDTIELTSPNVHYREPMLLARNTGAGFADVSSRSGAVFAQPWVSRGLATGDLDNDGRIDAVVTTNDGSLHILHNETVSSRHWLQLELVGHKSNRDGIGAAVTVVSAHLRQTATVTTTGSYLSSSDKRLHFGLGSDTAASRVEIRWPSGVRQTLADVTADRLLRVVEPSQ